MTRQNNINLEYYRVFYIVFLCNSITAAAEQLCISQPAVSQAIRQLETALGCRLFSRIPRGVKPTREGEVLFSYVKRGMEALFDGERMLSRIQDLETGEIRIGASDMTLKFYLLPYLEHFHEQYPKIKIMVSNAPTPETLELLQKGRIDFGIVSTPFDSKPELHSIPVRSAHNIFIAGSHYRSALGNRVLSYQELKEYPCIFLEQNTSTRRFMDQFLAKQQIHLEPEFELATSEMIVQFAKRNLGIGCLVFDFAREALEQGEVFSLAFEEKMPERQFCLVSSSKLCMSPAAKKLYEQLSQMAGQAAPKQ